MIYIWWKSDKDQISYPGLKNYILDNSPLFQKYFINFIIDYEFICKDETIEKPQPIILDPSVHSSNDKVNVDSTPVVGWEDDWESGI